MRSFKNSYKIFAGFLALVLVAGMTSPAFAQERPIPELAIDVDVEPLTLQEPPENLVYQNGNAPGGSPGLFLDDKFVADDFVLELSTELTDAHFTWFATDEGNNVEPLLYFILTDNGGEPGSVISSGVAQNVDNFELGPSHFETWFDFETPVPLNSGVTYWFALKYTENFAFIDPEPLWENADVITGNVAVFSASFVAVDINNAEWTPRGLDVWFQLTDDNNQAIGGTSIPVSTTTLLVAGAQANMGLWSLALVGIVGAAAAITYKVKSKKTKQ